MQQKALILGAKGNLGQQLVKVFTSVSLSTSSDYNVIAWDREEIDITDKELITKKVSDIKPDVIINAAAYNAVDKCETNEQEFELAKKLNREAVGYLADIAIENNALLVHYSTQYVFDGDKKEGYKEDDRPGPINKYSETKLMGEKEVIKRSGRGLKWYLIRSSKLFGPKGESKMAKPSFFDIMLELAKDKNEIDVVDEEVSCFTYTPDLAKVTKDLVESNPAFVNLPAPASTQGEQAGTTADKKSYGIYHIINSGSCTWYEAAVELFKIAGIDIKINPVTSDKFPRPAKRPKFSVLLNTKLIPLRDWRKALQEYLK